jgi:two-component system sensor histidine kinase QseC
VSDATRWFSLRRRLLLPVLAGVCAAWIATGVWVFVDLHHELHPATPRIARPAASMLTTASARS